MRVQSSALSVSWIPSEMVPTPARMVFDRGPMHYDPPPPDHIDDLEALRRADRFRFANELTAWIEVGDDGRIVDFGQDGQGHYGQTRLRLRSHDVSFAAVSFPELRPAPVIEADCVQFTQTVGCRTAVPAPRPVPRKPFVQWSAPTVWTTLRLTLCADGRVQHSLAGASSMPRHWLYDHRRRLIAKSAVVDMSTWMRDAFGAHTPWGEQDSPALMAAAESAIERQVSSAIMQGDVAPDVRPLDAGDTLVRQGEPGRELYLLLDGILTVEVAGEVVAEVGPGAVVGERAILEGGARTSTLRASTPARVAVVPEAQIDRAALAEISASHRREDG